MRSDALLQAAAQPAAPAAPAPPAPPPPPADFGDEIREIVRQSVQHAQQGAQDAARATGEEARMNAELDRARAEAGRLRVGAPGATIERRADGTLRITTRDGKTITIDRGALPAEAQNAILNAQTGAPVPIPIPMPMPSNQLLVAVVLIVAFLVAGLVLFPITRAIARRMDRRGQAPATPTDLGERLDRIEQAMEAVAIEVERVSEAQRYSARLLTERLPERWPELAPQGAVTAPAPAAPDTRR